MDYQSRYTGEEIDALLSKVATMQNAPRDFKVVASKRIPKTNWGPYRVRFTKGATFTLCPEKDNVIIEQDQIRFHAPVLAKMLTDGILDTVQGRLVGEARVLLNFNIFTNHDDVIIATPDIAEYIIESGHYVLQIPLISESAFPANGIRRNNDGTFETVHIDTAETTSPNIRIIGGNIVACGLPDVSNLGGNADMAVVVGSPCQIEYRRTGNKRPTQGPSAFVHRKIRWTFAFNNGSASNSVGRICIAAGSQIYPHAGSIIRYFQRNKREMIWVRLHSICKKHRYTSPLYREVHIVRLIEREP